MKNLFQIGQDNLIKKEYIRKNGYDFEDKEAYFQELIAKNKELLPVSDINGTYGDIQFLLREFVLPVGRIDDLFIDSNGSFVIVETKLFKNPEGKREVIAQILDYVSYIFSGDLSYEELIIRLNKQLGKDFYQYLLDERFITSKDNFEKKVLKNFKSQKIMLIIAGDSIHGNVVSIVNYLKKISKQNLNIGLVNLNMFEINETIYCIPELVAKTYKLDLDEDFNNADYSTKLQIAEFIANFKENKISKQCLSNLLEDFKKHGFDVRCGSQDCICDLRNPKITSLFAFGEDGAFQYRRSYWVDFCDAKSHDESEINVLDEFLLSYEEKPHNNKRKNYWHLDLSKIYDDKQSFFNTLSEFIKNIS